MLVHQLEDGDRRVRSSKMASLEYIASLRPARTIGDPV